MDPLDCDGEANPRPISADVAAFFVPLAEGYFADDGRNYDCDTVTPNSEQAKGRIQGAVRRRIGCPRDQMPCSTAHLLAGWDGEDRRIRGEADDCAGPPAPKPLPLGVAVALVDWLDAGLRIDAALRDCDDTPTIDVDVLGYLDEIREVVALSTQPRRCTLCSCEIPAHARRLVWSWANDNDENLVLHAHLGCDAIRREIDLGEWTQGDLVDRLVAWHEGDRLNHDLGKLYLDLTNEELDDMGKEIIAAAIGSVADDSDTDVDSACIMRHAATSPMSKGRIEMAVLGCSTDVESVTVTDNPTVEPATVDGVTLPALSIRVVVSPSTLSPEALENVARAIHDHTSLGVETVGDCCIVLVGLDGIGRSIRFDLVDRAAL